MLDLSQVVQDHLYFEPSHIRNRLRAKRIAVGEVLKADRHVAILGPPGSGKTTLLKRLATAYASPERKQLVRDGLPSEQLLPLLLRCRELGALARKPLRYCLARIPEFADLVEIGGPFEALATSALRSGSALVLLDGLDEIVAETDRTAFVEHVRTFISTYPKARLVLTSREPGFRSVAEMLFDHCAP